MDGPAVVTTVRIPIDEWNFVKQRKLEFTALLRKQIRSMINQEELADAANLIRERRALEPGPVSEFKSWLAERNRQGLRTTAEEMVQKRKELGI